MPEMNGFDVCNTVRNILGIKDVYILMLTAKGQEEIDKQRGKDVGVNYYVTKPFDLDDLLEKIVNILGIEM
jgi:two-component system alkaline phosphatase synthesis response regulator PhoP